MAVAARATTVISRVQFALHPPGPLPYAPRVRSASTSLRGHPPSVPDARRWTVSTLTSWGLDVTAWSAAQVVSELATNCTLHARSDFALRLTVEGECVRVEATDGVPGGLHARQYSSTATTGRTQMSVRKD